LHQLISNRNNFVLPADGWYQLAPFGEHPHAAADCIQVIDADGCRAMVDNFTKAATDDNFAGLLVDFDHFSLNNNTKSEAAGWITNLETRDNGLWAKIRWSDSGEEAITGGRYRFISPVWRKEDCETLEPDTEGTERLRPIRLLNAAVTNDPNIKNMVPLSNRNAQPNTEEKRLKWVLGDNDNNCPSCIALAGQVHTKEQWEKAGLAPGSKKLHCKDNCHCSFVPTTDPIKGNLARAPQRKEHSMKNKAATPTSTKTEPVIENNWSDAARAASLAVRRAQAAARKRTPGTGGSARISKPSTPAKPSPPPSKGKPKTPIDEHTTDPIRGVPDDPAREQRDLRPGINPPDQRTGVPTLPPGEWDGRNPKENETLPYPPPAREDIHIALDSLAQDAMDAFEEKYGKKPATDSDIVESQDLAGWPEWAKDDGYSTGTADHIDAILKQSAKQGRQQKIDAMPPIDPEEDFDRTIEAIRDYQADAREQYRAEFGAYPIDEDEIQLAEEMAGVPEKYRLGGVFSPREVAQRLTDPHEEAPRGDADPGHQEVEREAERQTQAEQEAKMDFRLGEPAGDADPGFQADERTTAGQVDAERYAAQTESDALDATAERLIQTEAEGGELTEAEQRFLDRYREMVGDLSTFMDNRAKDAVYEMKMAARGFVILNRRK
jgi:hypothetical protein